MIRRTIKTIACLLALAIGIPAQAEMYTLTGRVTMAPVVTGPSGYMAALNNGAQAHRFFIERLGGDTVALRAVTGGYLRAGNTQWNYLSLDGGAIDSNARFVLQRSGDQVSLRSEASGLYVGYNLRSGRLRAAFPDQDANTLWQMQRVNAVGEPEDDSGFLGQHWPVQTFRDAQGRWLTLSPNQAARMQFVPRRSQDGLRVQIDTLCDSFQSALQLQPPHIRFVSFENTRFPCDQADRVLSQAYLDMLARTTRFSMSARRVSLIDAQGETIGVFQR